jgi:alpha-tubulin suppressor-like RCC1 family protein/uncharacterized protein YjdB
MKNLFLGLAAAIGLAAALACGGDGGSAPQQQSARVTGVTLSADTLSLTLGQPRPLIAHVFPQGAANRAVTWASSAPGVVAASGSGESVTLDAHAPGAATITVTTADGGFTARCSVTVDDGLIHVDSLTFDMPALTLAQGATRRIGARLLPADADDTRLEWASSDRAVATVAGGSDSAMVTGVANGRATITATSVDGGLTATCAVTVEPYTVPLVGLLLSSPQLDLAIQVSNPITIAAAALPSNAVFGTPTWTSSNTSVATVTGNGLSATVTPVALGNATITVASGSVRATCNASVLVAPQVIPEIKTLHPSIDLAFQSSGAIRADGTLWTWGQGGNGRLGHGNTANLNAPTQVGQDANWAHISMGYLHGAAVRSNGTLWAWGVNSYGQLGRGYTSQTEATPAQAGADTNWKIVAAGDSHTMAIKTDGTLWGAGLNNSGQLGDGTTANRSTFVRIGTATNWVAVECGVNHTVALRADGTLWAWGVNSAGQVGDGTTVVKNAGPVQIGTAFNDWKAVSAGDFHSAGIRADGSLWTWGNGGNGRLGHGTTTNLNVPTRVGSDSDWASVSGGGSHTVALRNWGGVFAWGQNSAGQLGNGTTTLSATPVMVGGEIDWVAVASSAGDHAAALKVDGGLWIWGANGQGQVGNGTSVNQTVPLRIGTGFRVD